LTDHDAADRCVMTCTPIVWHGTQTVPGRCRTRWQQHVPVCQIDHALHFQLKV